MSDIDVLCAHLAANRFMPIPPPELISCGDGDFRGIGAEFLGRLVRDAGLLPGHRVLDIGCGVGRLALPMTQYLDQSGTYDGIDPLPDAIKWCAAAITPVYPNVRFQSLDLRHPLYNPGGILDTATVRLPFDDGTFDIVCMISVLTHLHEQDVLRYAEETARLLAPGGLCFATAFLMNPRARAALAAEKSSLDFDPEGSGPVYEGDAVPLAAVAFDEDMLVEKFLRHGLHRRLPVQYGRWSGRASASFQDICIFEKG